MDGREMKTIKNDTRTLYERNIQDRSQLRYILGLIARWKQNFKYARARRIARKRGATIGEGVIMPVSLAKCANKNLIVGDHTSIHTNNFSSFRFPVKIGSHVIIGANVRITVGTHNIDSKDFESCRPNSGLVIEDYVWLCPDSVILPSCSVIGYGSVVGANAVVPKNTEPMSVLGGNPAKELRKRKQVHSDLVVESLLGGDLKEYIKTRKKKGK